jgi:hypothetical protein
MADRDPEPPLPEPRHVRPPVQCTLWSKPELIAAAKDRFETVETFVDESHLHRALLKCRECGQLYFSEFFEIPDWDDGDDAQYTTYVPVETAAEIEALENAEVMDVLLYTPRLQRDFPKGAKAATVRWIGKED